MSESYRVVNNTRGPVSFSLYKHMDVNKLQEVAEHHRRKAMRSSIISVTIPNGMSVDLVEKYGLTLEELKNNSELHRMVQSNKLSVVEEELDISKKPEEVKEEPKVEELEVEEESVKVQKKKANKKKSGKE